MNLLRLLQCWVASALLLLGSSCRTPPPVAQTDPVSKPSYNHDVTEVYDGATIAEACNRFIDDYFKDLKKGETRPHHGLSLIYEHDEEARVQFYVYKAVWGYSEELVLRKREGRWYVTRRENYQTYDF